MSTATAVAYAQHPCPKCGAKLYDNRATKSNPKSPDFKCSGYKNGCDYVEWPPRGAAPKTAPTKPASPSYNSHASKPEAELPELLRNAEAEDAAELAGKVGFDIKGIQNTLSLYQSVYEWYVATIVPIATKADIGASPESVNAGVATIMIQAKGK